MRWVICLLVLMATWAPAHVSADPPAVHDDYKEVLEDSNYSQNQIDVLANDEPFPNRPMEIVGVTQGTHGSVINFRTLLAYQPDPDYYGPDEFTYTVDDGRGGNHTATVYITVIGINDPPVLRDDTAITDEDTPVVIDVLANDTDKEGPLDPTSVERVSGPSHGRVAIDKSTGAITYRPDQDWHGQDAFTYRACDTGFPLPPLCATASVYITVNPVPDPPIADAGPDQSVPTLSTVTLDGSGSYDPDGEVELTYLWRQTGGTQQVTLSAPTAQSPTFVAPDDPDVLEFSLRVFDDQGWASETPDIVQITVTNQAPVAHAGPDQRVPTGTLVTLDGSGSYDPDHDKLTYEWMQTDGPRVSLSSTDAVSPTFTAPATPSKLTFALRVRDAYGERSPQDQITVDVYEPPIFALHLPLVVSNYATLPDLVVKTITASRNNIQVVIENRGSAAVTQGFYVDAYVNPQRAPIGAHEGWDAAGVSSGRGLVWAIEVGQTSNPSLGIIAPLMPGSSLTLNVNDAFYRPEYSSMSWPLAAGTPIYAQADSFPAPSPHDGLVLETHEYYDGPYNNIAGPVISTSATSSAVASLSRSRTGSPPGSLLPRR